MIDFKVSTLDTDGGLSVVEGEYVIEVGEERYELDPGDSVLAPRQVAHVWAHLGEGKGRLIATLQPAGEIEEFFDELARLGGTPRHEELSTPNITAERSASR